MSATLKLFTVRLIKKMQKIQLIASDLPKFLSVAPMKALCHEKLEHWRRRFDPLGVLCEIITGDSVLQDLSSILPYHILITTPEKWDSLSRRWKECPHVFSAIKLFMIDEIHLLNEDRRGATLEAVITRMKTIHSSSEVVAHETYLHLVSYPILCVYHF